MKFPMIHTHGLVLATCFAVGAVAQATDTIDSASPAILIPGQVTPIHEAVESSSTESTSVQSGDDLKAFGWTQTESNKTPDQKGKPDTVSSNDEFTEDAPELVAETATPGQELTMTFPLETEPPVDSVETTVDPIVEIEEQVAAAISENPSHFVDTDPASKSLDTTLAEPSPIKADDEREQTITVIPVITEFAPATPNAETPLPLNVDVSVNADR